MAECCNCLLWMQAAHQLNEADRVLFKSPLSFDASVWELFWPLMVGAGVVVARARRTPGQLLSCRVALSGEKVTVAHFVPSMLSLFLEEEGIEQLDSLSWSYAEARRFRRIYFNVPSIASARRFIIFMARLKHLSAQSTGSAEPRDARWLVPIGRPLANVEVYILDANQHPVPVGAVGELYTGGAGLARGYLRQPALTAEKFLPNPFSRAGSQRLYRTGDLARYEADGAIEFLGRVDRQVKLRGVRIELGEVETVLGRHPAVREAIVDVREDTPGDQRLVAYITPEKEHSPKVSELQGYMKKRLPDNMVPSAFVLMDALPLSPNGKFDRRALPAPEATRPELEETFVAPRNHIQESLAKIWAEVLKLEQVGIHDRFFELGGHSLLGIYLLNRIREVWGRVFPLSILVQGATIEQMATMLQQETTVPELSFVAIQPQGSRRPFFAGGSSRRYVDLARFLGPDQPFYRFDIYALQEQRLDRGDEPYAQVEAIAAHFVNEIRAVQPIGPYSLGGGCEGGVVAFEIARQLQEQSQEVAQLIIWETSPSGIYHKKPLYPLIRSAHIIGSLLRREPGDVLAAVLTRWRKIGISGSIDGGAVGSRHAQIQDSISGALRRFVPQPYTGRITLFQAREQRPGYFETKKGWEDIATAELEVYTIPGNHTTCFDKHFLDFAEQLKICLNRDQEVA